MKWSNSYRMRLVLIGFVAGIVFGSENVKADFTFGTPTNLGPTINTSYTDTAGTTSVDGLELYIVSGRPPATESNWDTWLSTRTTTEDAWGQPVRMEAPLNTSYDDGAVFISSDALELYLYSLRPGGSGSSDIWVAKRESRDSSWNSIVNLGPIINSSSTEWIASMSADGLELYFDSNRSGGFGGFDLYMATRTTKDEDWGSPVNLGPKVNSSSNAFAPYLSPDGRYLFFSDYYNNFRSGGLGGGDIWVTRRLTINDDWEEPVNLGPKINSTAHDGPAYTPDGSILYFVSTRSGGYGGAWGDIYQAPIIPIVDFNGDGVVDATDMCIMIDHWGENYSLCDIGPTPLGDGIVDVEDLKVLAEHLFEESFPPGLLAYWKLDETEGDTAHDSIEGNDGFGPPNLLWRPEDGKVGGALELDGIDDSIVTTFSLNPAQTTFSAFAWIKGGGPEQVALSQSDGVNWLLTDSEGQLMTALRRGSSGPTLTSGYIITDGDWHHIGVVWDKSHRHLYRDGIEVAEDTSNIGYLSASNGNLCIGCGNAFDTNSFFSGLIDDVRIYDVALTAEEISALAQ
jgi:hypothetical protein